jgi:hypothetical protein
MPKSTWWRLCFAVLLLAGTGLGQTQLQKKTLVLNGQSGAVTFFEIDGHYYIDLSTLARIGNGSLSFSGNQITLNFPPAASTDTAPSADQAPVGLSDNFMTTAIQELNVIKEWRSIIAYGLTRNVPGDGSRLVLNRDKAAEGLRLSTVAASTPSDKQALSLLTIHYNNVSKWYSRMVEARKNMATANYAMSEDALKDDPLYQKIVSCSNALGTMLPSGTFSDDGSCQP